MKRYQEQQKNLELEKDDESKKETFIKNVKIPSKVVGDVILQPKRHLGRHFKERHSEVSSSDTSN